MLLKRNFDPSYLEEVASSFPKVGKSQLRTTIFAFALLQALIDSGLTFIFKGGTSLLLLLSNPQRLSTDIDIVVPRNTDFDSFFEKVKKRFPFYRGEERGKSQNRSFRHFYFHPKINDAGEDLVINLDVAFENDPFLETIEKEISLPFLLTGGVKSYVRLPSISSLLGEKLTAFAPHTVGVNPFFTSLGKPIDNRLQVVKQLFDIARLFDERPSFQTIKENYLHSIAFENAFRGTSFSAQQILKDSFEASCCIASYGQLDAKKEFVSVYKPGIQGLSSNVFSGIYRQEDAANDATKVALICAGIYRDIDVFYNRGPFPYTGKSIRYFKRLRDPEAFLRIRNAFALMEIE